MTTGSGAITGSGGGGGLEDDFERTVATGSLPTGWGVGDIGTWEESADSDDDTYSHGYPARLAESVNGSEGVMDYRTGYINDVNPLNIYYNGMDVGPVILFAGPHSLDDKGYASPPFDVSFDLRFDALIEPDNELWVDAMGYAYLQFAILVLPDAEVTESWKADYTNAAQVHYISLWDYWDYAAFIEVFLNSSAETWSIEAYAEYTSSTHYSGEQFLTFASFAGAWWTFKMYVDFDGIRVKMYPRGQAEPDDFTLWDYDDTEHREVTTYNSGGQTYINDPDQYNMLGFSIYGPSFRRITPQRYWQPTATFGYIKTWDCPNPNNGGAYVPDWGTESHYFSRQGNPRYSASVAWPIFEPHWVCAQTGQEQIIACWSQTVSDWSDWSPVIPSEVASVTVRGTVWVGVGGYPTDGGPTSGWITVHVKRYTFNQSHPATDSQEILGGETVATVSCWWTVEQGWFPTSTSSNAYFEFTSTRDQLSADGFLQWGVFIEDAAALRCADGRVTGGLCQPATGGYSAHVGGPNPVWNEQYQYWERGSVEYDVTYNEPVSPVAPDGKYGEWRVDNIVVNGGSSTTVYGQ